MGIGINYSEELFRLYSHHDFNISDVFNENIDFDIEVGSHTYWGSAFTISSIQAIMHKQALFENEIYGTYFWGANFIIIKEFTLDCLVNAIRHLVITGDYQEAFYLSDDD